MSMTWFIASTDRTVGFVDVAEHGRNEVGAVHGRRVRRVGQGGAGRDEARRQRNTSRDTEVPRLGLGLLQCVLPKHA